MNQKAFNAVDVGLLSKIAELKAEIETWTHLVNSPDIVSCGYCGKRYLLKDWESGSVSNEETAIYKRPYNYGKYLQIIGGLLNKPDMLCSDECCDAQIRFLTQIRKKFKQPE